MTLKRCTKCNCFRELSCFVAQAAAKDGLNPWCRDCHKKARAKSYRLNREREIAATMLRRDPLKFKQYMQAWRRDNPLVVAENSRRQHQKISGDPVLKEKVRQQRLRRYRENPEPYLDRNRACRAKRTGSKVVERVSRRKVHQRDGGCCYLCNNPVLLEKMHLDHKIPRSKGGEHSYANVGVTCAECNLRKGSKIVA